MYHPIKMIIVFKIDCYQVLIKTTDPKFILLVKKDGTYVGVGLEVCQRNGIDDFFFLWKAQK